MPHQIVRRVLHRRWCRRHRAGGDPCRRSGRQGLAAAMDRTAASSTKSTNPRCWSSRSETLRANDAKPATKYVAVPIDLRQDWPKALREAGFEPAEPYRLVGRGIAALPARRRARICLFERIQSSAPGAVASRSRHSVPSSSIREYLDQRRATDAADAAKRLRACRRDGRPGRAVVPRGARRRRGLAWRARLAGHPRPRPAS